ncbi:MAG: flagellar hook-associated protein FlgK [Alteromonadaceae bacterium]|nr:flagellar hook-associated protein FlgK [Alteromonadaceae bacterium]
MIQTDIFTIAESGLNAQQSLINTTANNIANVNTEGYIRQRGNLEEQSVGGVLNENVERVIDKFAQRQNITDTTRLGEAEIFFEKIDQLDELYASEASSISGSMTRFFSALQTATDEPNNESSRQLVLGHAEALVGQFESINNYLINSVENTNAEIDAVIDQANDLITSISELNEQIAGSQFGPQTSGSESVKNSRDQAILELAKIIDITTIEQSSGATQVLMKTGQSLVLEDGTFNLLSAKGNPDPTSRDIELVIAGSGATSGPSLDSDSVGGELEGLLSYRDDVVGTSQRELGQLALAFADAMNEQNNLGMDLDGQLGTDIFSLPTFNALGYEDNSNVTLQVNAQLVDGGGDDVLSADYQITIDAVTTGTPDTVDFTVAILNPDGTPVTDSTGTAVTQTFTGVEASAGTFTAINGGLEIELPDGDSYVVGDQFLLQPSKEAASNLSLAINRAEDLAFATPIRVDSSINNLGSATVTDVTVTNTFVDNTNADANSSAFDGAGGLQAPGASPDTGGLGAPTTIVFTGSDSYEVRDSAGTTITTVSGATNLQNLLAQAEASGTGPVWDAEFSALNDYPGYDISLAGVPKAGDSFTIGYNTNGYNDNSNGVKLAALEDSDLVLQSNDGNTNKVSFNEKYTSIVNDVGTQAATAEINYDAAVALERQSSDWFNSSSGVSLDEEAADLIRFQQAYTASARVLSTAQSLFETILGAVR